MRSLLPKLKCKECRSELCFHTDDPHSFRALDLPIFANITCFKQRGGLLFPSAAVLKIVKAAKVLESFSRKGYPGKKKTLEKKH